MAKKRRKRPHCLNCGQQLTGAENFCSNCGQENHDINVPLSHLLLDIIENFFHFDTKFFRAVKSLFLHPGRITREFNEGKRVLYPPPARIYIFVSILYFVVAGMALKKEYGPGLKFGSTLKDSEGKSINGSAFTADYTQEELQFLLNAKPYQMDSVLTLRGSSAGWANQLALRQAVMSRLDPKYNVHLMEKVIKSISFALFLLMPIFAFFVKVVHLRRKMLYVQHLIFSIHAHTMFFLILLVSQLIYLAFSHSVLGWAFFAALLYLLISMKNVYQGRWIPSILRFMLLLVLYFIVVVIALAISIISGAMMI